MLGTKGRTGLTINRHERSDWKDETALKLDYEIMTVVAPSGKDSKNH